MGYHHRRAGIFVACENSRPSSLPARVAFRVNRRPEEGRLFAQARIFAASGMGGVAREGGQIFGSASFLFLSFFQF